MKAGIKIKRFSCLLIVSLIILLCGCGADNIAYEVNFDSATLFRYPHIARESYISGTNIVVVSYGFVFCSASNLDYEIKGNESQFTDFIKALPEYKFMREADGQEYYYIRLNGEYLSISCKTPYDKKTDCSVFNISKNIASAHVGTDGVFAEHLEFVFPVSESAMFDIAVSAAGQKVSLDFDFLLEFYSFVPNAKISDNIIKVAAGSHSSGVAHNTAAPIFFLPQDCDAFSTVQFELMPDNTVEVSFVSA